MKRLPSILPGAGLLSLLLLGAVGNSAAFGLDEIYTPNAEYREISIEYSRSGAFDPRAALNGAQSGEFTLEAGVTPRLQLEVSGQSSKDPGSAMQLQAREIEARYQLLESGEYWLDAGVLLAYANSTLSGQADSLEMKLLLKNDSGKFTHTANIGFSQDVGRYAEHSGGPDWAFLWNSRYRFSSAFQPGIELQSGLGQHAQLGHFNEQEHYLGPSIYGKLFNHLKYQAAYLYGISDPAARHALRLLVEYENHF